ncbi:hypothetical protein [uncultured Flavobacterium sp.]|uniref:hypothetical protein n=1 Tax=uncultured Flavobacterium sp. TaxID=165435 RepID=UPI0025DE5205|nr:hypothetical protein [uncultured Flavobacterium sp.]
MPLHYLTPKLLKEAEGKHNTLQADIMKLCKKLDSFIHAPVTGKEISRMESFAGNEELVRFVSSEMKKYFDGNAALQSPAENEYYDVISFWYCVALLILAEDNEFIPYFTKKFIDSEHKDIYLLRRTLNNSGKGGNCLAKVEAYFDGVNSKTDIYIWAKSIGLELPGTHDWDFYICLQASSEARFITVYLIGKAPDGKGNSYEIRVTERATMIDIATEKTIYNLKGVIAELESTYNFKFELTSSAFRGKIKNKTAIKKWLGL